MEILQRLAVALALGLLIGTERGWQERATEEGRRVAGIRTFGLIGLLGALWALLAEELGELVLGLAFAAFAALIITARFAPIGEVHDRGITTAVAALLTFALGAVAMRGMVREAAAAAVVITVLLGIKPVLHRWLELIEQRELFAAFKLLLISVVLLPILPNQGFGPWEAINPYVIWWWVVLIASLSFAGYFAVKLMGAGQGILLTGLFGGLASSTAVTLNFSRLGRAHSVAQPLLATGVVAAAGTMFPRVTLEVAVVNAELLSTLIWPMLAMTLTSYLVVLVFWRMERLGRAPPLSLTNPFELMPALQFGALLVIVILLSRAFQAWFGDLGIYLLAGIAGLSDVDAITLSLSRLARNGLPAEVAVRAIVLATLVNTAAKGFLVALFCGGTMAKRVGVVFLATSVVGVATLWLSER